MSAEPWIPEHADIDGFAPPRRAAGAASSGNRPPRWSSRLGTQAPGSPWVGEQPGDGEDQPGIPFVGPAGTLPQMAHIKACRPWLERELTVVDPTLIVEHDQAYAGLVADLRVAADIVTGSNASS